MFCEVFAEEVFYSKGIPTSYKGNPWFHMWWRIEEATVVLTKEYFLPSKQLCGCLCVGFHHGVGVGVLPVNVDWLPPSAFCRCSTP